MELSKELTDGQVVIVDTNCLLYSVENKLDLFESISQAMEGKGKYSIIVPSSVISELMSMAGKTGKQAATATVAISIFSSREIHPIRTEMKADAWIKQISKQLSDLGKTCYVCTYDKALKKNLKELGAVIISLKR